jgi:hypothetical protein
VEIKNSLDDEMILIAGLIGAIATVAAEITSRILLFLRLAKYGLYKFDSLIITNGRPSILIGLILNFLIGSILSVMIYLILKKWGHRYTIIISIMFTLIMWFTWEIVFTIFIEGKIVPIRPMTSYYSHFIVSIVNGVFLGLMQKRFIFKRYR